MYFNINEIEAPELAERLQVQTPRVIDVREMQEIAAGTVPGAEPMPMTTLPARLHELDRNDELVIICRSGARSAQVCMFLQQNGYENVFNLRGGMISWARSGQQIGRLQGN